ncbi:MAG TPA: hypothetical protein VJV75_04300 [Candidatus Polarisedimenticolia bacterium]|nr:hypothetical protein [Candidatus Polarisedimenticolia bacterium]
MRNSERSTLQRLFQDAVLAAALLAAGAFILMSSQDRVKPPAAPKPPEPVVVFRGIPMEERAAGAQSAPAASGPAPPAPAAPAKPESMPIAAPDRRGSSKGGPVIELVYDDRSVLQRQASQYGFRVLPPGQPPPAGSVGSIDCPGFSLHFDRALYRRINQEIGPLTGLPRGSRISVTLAGGRLRRLS